MPPTSKSTPYSFLILSILGILAAAFIMPSLHAPDAGSDLALPGDLIIENPEMHFNHIKRINAPASAIWPWVLAVGKGRGGWYTTKSFERILPKYMHAARTIDPSWTALKVGDRVEDYGFDEKEDFFIVDEIVPERALVFKSERYGTVFTWSLIIEEKEERVSDLLLRFRGRIQRTGWSRKFLVWGGGWMDHLTTSPMLAGLKERAEQSKVN